MSVTVRRFVAVVVVATMVAVVMGSPTAQDQILAAVAHVSPWDATWKANVPFSEWAGVTCSGQAIMCTLVFDGATSNGTLQAGFLDVAALNTSFPAQSITVHRLGVRVDMTALPQSLVAFNVTDSANFTTFTQADWGCPANHVNLTAPPPNLATLVLRNSGVTGRLDLWWLKRIRVLDVSGNPGLVGSLDVTPVALIGAAPVPTAIVIQGTSIERIIFIAGQPVDQFITTAPYGTPLPNGMFWSLYVDPTTQNLGVPAGHVLSLVPMYFCRGPEVDPNDPDNIMVDLLSVYHDETWNRDEAWLVRNTTVCHRDLTTRMYYVGNGYMADSAAWATSFAKCLPGPDPYKNFGYVLKGKSIENSLLVVNASDEGETTTYGLCDSVANVATYERYYSQTIAPLFFIDLFMNSTFARMRLFKNGTLSVCDYPWPVVFEAPVRVCPPQGPCVSPTFNFAHIREKFATCLPLPADVITPTPDFTRWGNMGPYGVQWHLLESIRDTVDNFALDLNKFAPVPLGVYCFTSSDHVFELHVNANGTAMHRVRFDGTRDVSPLWPQVVLYDTSAGIDRSGLEYRIRHLQSLLDHLARYLPKDDPQTLQPFGNFTAQGSGYRTWTRGDPTGGFFLANSAGTATIVFSQTACAVPLVATTYCAPVDFGRRGATAVLQVLPSGAINMTLWRTAGVPLPSTAGQGSVSVGYLARCNASAVPLWARPNEFPPNLLSGVLPVSQELTRCMPNASRTQVLKLPFTSGIYTPFNDSPERGSIDLDDSNAPPNTIRFSAGQCLSSWNASEGGAIGITECNYAGRFETSNVIVGSPGTAGAGDARRCVLGDTVCGQLRTASWHPRRDALAAWHTGFADVSDVLPLSAMRWQRNAKDVDVQACVPNGCYVDSSRCGDLAAWTADVAACVLSRGGQTRDLVPIPELPSPCADGPVGAAAFAAVVRWLQQHPDDQRVHIECGRETPVVWAVLDGRRAFTVGFAAEGLDLACSTCVPLVVESSIALPFEVLIFSAVVNVLVILVANYLLDPFIGPRLVSLKMVLFAPALLLSHRERRRLRDRLESQLTPQFLEDDAVDAHVHAVVDAVEREHERVRVYEPGQNDTATRRADRLTRRRFEKAYRSILLDHERHLDPKCIQRPSVLACLLRIRVSCARYDHTSRTFMHNAADDDATISTATRRAMDSDVFGTNHRAAADTSVDPAPASPPGTAKKKAATTPESELPLLAADDRDDETERQRAVADGSDDDNDDDIVGPDDDDSPGHSPQQRDDADADFDARLASTSTVGASPYGGVQGSSAPAIDARSRQGSTAFDDCAVEVSVSDFKRQSIDKSNSIGRALLALDANVDAQWIAFARAADWLDRRSLIPKEWLLFLQDALVLAYFVACLIAGVRSGGFGDQSRPAAGTVAWREYEAVYFAFLNSTMPGALLVNAAFRIAYGRRLRRRPKDSTWHFAKRYAQHVLADPFLMAPVVVILPALVTHIVPMWAMFLPLTLVNIVGVAGATVLVRKCPAPPARLRDDRKAFAMALGSRILLRVVATVAVVGSLQFAFNYGVLVYDRQTAWSDAFGTEWQARSLPCALDVLEASGQGLVHRLTMLLS